MGVGIWMRMDMEAPQFLLVDPQLPFQFVKDHVFLLCVLQNSLQLGRYLNLFHGRSSYTKTGSGASLTSGSNSSSEGLITAGFSRYAATASCVFSPFPV